MKIASRFLSLPSALSLIALYQDIEIRDKESFRQMLSQSTELRSRIQGNHAVKFDDFDNPDAEEFQILPIELRSLLHSPCSAIY